MSPSSKKKSLYPREYRLKKSGEVKCVFAHGAYVHAGWIALKFSPRSESYKTFPANRLCIVSPKKFFPKAIQRNTFKRIAREIFRTEVMSRTEKKPYDTVLYAVAKPERDEKKYYACSIQKAFREAGFL